MNINSLKPAGQLAQRFGVKSIIYGAPGTGKTPMIQSAPNPVLIAVEPGLLSMRNSNVPTFEAYKAEQIDEFFEWFLKSAESKKFDTLGVDSISQICEIFLTQELQPSRNKDGRAAYGKMATRVMKIVNDLYYFPNKHIYLIGKQDMGEDGYKKPYFPGKVLNVEIPHLFDEILHIGMYNVPGVAGSTMAIRTRSDFSTLARDRSGMLNEFEPPNIGDLFIKAMK